MITAIFVFFLAIFGGILFLMFLIWFFVRRPASHRLVQGHSGSAGAIYEANPSDDIDDNLMDFESDPVETGYRFSEPENPAREGWAGEISGHSENVGHHSHHSDSSTPADLGNYSSSSDSGSSYDSSSSSDSGSSDSSSSSSSD